MLVVGDNAPAEEGVVSLTPLSVLNTTFIHHLLQYCIFRVHAQIAVQLICLPPMSFHFHSELKILFNFFYLGFFIFFIYFCTHDNDKKIQ